MVALCFPFGHILLFSGRLLRPSNLGLNPQAVLHPTKASSSAQVYAQEKAPTLIDPAGPTISLTSSEQVFVTGGGAERLRLRP